MPVHDRVWKPYAGSLTDLNWRFLVLPRYASREVFKTRIFTFYFTACFIYPLICTGLIYFKHNLDLLPSGLGELIGNKFHYDLDGGFFLGFLRTQSILGWVLTMIVGPAMVAPDLVNGALPLYLSRPITRFEYVIGKASLLVGLLSVVTWVPGMLLYALEGGLDKGPWFFENLRLLFGTFAGSLLTIVCLVLPSLAISAMFKSVAAARAVFVMFFFGSIAAGGMVRAVLRSDWAFALSPNRCLIRIWATLLGANPPSELPVALAVATLVALVAISIWMLARRLRPLEVVK